MPRLALSDTCHPVSFHGNCQSRVGEIRNARKGDSEEYDGPYNEDLTPWRFSMKGSLSDRPKRAKENEE